MQADNTKDPVHISKTELIQKTLQKVQRQNLYIYNKQISEQNEQKNQLYGIQIQINDIKQQLTKLNNHLILIGQSKSVSAEEANKNFLLTEFHELCNFWRHTDKRVESSISLYLTISTIITSSSIILFQSQANNQGTFPLSTLLTCSCFLLSIAGFFVSTRIVSASVLKAEYIYSINLIRRFFSETNPDYLPYLYMPIAQVKMNEKDLIEFKFKTSHPNFSLLPHFINIFSSFTLGISVASLIYSYNTGTNLLIEISTAIIIFIGTLIAISFFQKGRLKIGMKHLLNQRREQLHK